jgi:hypothetical protein
MWRMLVRMLVLAVMVFACGFTMRLAWESLEEPSEAQAQSPAEGNLYDCKDFTTPAEAQGQLLPGDPYGLDADNDGTACDELGGGGGASASASATTSASASASASPVAAGGRREIAHLSTVLDIPDYREDVDNEKVEAIRAETRKTLRDLAGQLWASLWAIPLYNVFAFVRLVPKANNVTSATVSLTVWSYFMMTATDGNEFADTRQRVAELLGINHTLPFVFEHDPDAGVPIEPEQPD